MDALLGKLQKREVERDLKTLGMSYVNHPLMFIGLLSIPRPDSRNISQKDQPAYAEYARARLNAGFQDV